MSRNDFSSFLIEEIRLQLERIDEASNHEEVEEGTDNARRYLIKLEELIGGETA